MARLAHPELPEVPNGSIALTLSAEAQCASPESHRIVVLVAAFQGLLDDPPLKNAESPFCAALDFLFSPVFQAESSERSTRHAIDLLAELRQELLQPKPVLTIYLLVRPTIQNIAVIFSSHH